MPIQRVFVVGVGMTNFEKPGRRSNFDYPDMAKEAVSQALADAGIEYKQVKQACVGYVYGDSTCGQRALYPFGKTGIPIYNVNNNCATGSTALFLAKQLVEYGVSDCVLALGFEKMERGSLGSKYDDRTNPMEKHVEKMAEYAGFGAGPVACQFFANAAIEHMKKYGTTPVHLAKIAWKNHKHSVKNPRSQFRDEYTLDQIMQSPKVFGPLTKLQCCPTSDGAAAAIIVSEDFVRRHGLQNKAVEVVGMEMATDPTEFKDCIRIAGYDMTRLASKRLYEKTGISPSQVDVVELHDCFSANEMLTYEGLGLCGEGEAGKLIDAGDNTYGGKYVVNPSGGLVSKGHPLGATGLAQCAELTWQLRGEADQRQVRGAKVALQHNLGLGGAVVVALYRMGFPQVNPNAVSAIASSPEGFEAHKYMKILEIAMQEDKEDLINAVRGIYGFRVRNGPGGSEGYWVINAKTGKGKVTFNGSDKPDVTFIVNDNDVVELISGKINPQKAFFQGKIKIQGNMGLAMKLTDLQRRASGKIEELRSKL